MIEPTSGGGCTGLAVPESVSVGAGVNRGDANSARVWVHLLGGRDCYEVDRAAVAVVEKVFPEIRAMAAHARHFHRRVVRYLVDEVGVRQFLDIGAGYPADHRATPSMANTHDIAQSLAADARVAYVDNDLVVLAHARALLGNSSADRATAVIDGDLHLPDRIVEAAREVLDFEVPVAVMLLQVLGHVASLGDARRAVDKIMEAVPVGSYLVISDFTADGADDVVSDAEVAAVRAEYAATGAGSYAARSCAVLRSVLGGLEIVEPGLVSVNHWRPNVEGGRRPAALPFYGAVARKPGRGQ